MVSESEMNGHPVAQTENIMVNNQQTANRMEILEILGVQDSTTEYVFLRLEMNLKDGNQSAASFDILLPLFNSIMINIMGFSSKDNIPTKLVLSDGTLAMEKFKGFDNSEEVSKHCTIIPCNSAIKYLTQR